MATHSFLRHDSILRNKDHSLTFKMMHKTWFYLFLLNQLQTFKNAHSYALYIFPPDGKDSF